MKKDYRVVKNLDAGRQIHYYSLNQVKCNKDLSATNLGPVCLGWFPSPKKLMDEIIELSKAGDRGIMDAEKDFE